MLRFPQLVEIVVLMTLAVASIAMYCHRAGSNLKVILARGVGLLACGFLGWWAFQLVLLATANLIAGLVIGLVLSTVAYYWLKKYVSRIGKHRKNPNRQERPAMLPTWLDVGLTTMMILLIWLAAGIATVFVGEIMMLTPTGQTWIGQTKFMQSLVDAELIGKNDLVSESNVPSEKKTSISIGQAAAEQADFFRRFSSGLRQSKETVFQATGLDELQREIQLTRRVLNLSDEDKIWLLQNHPKLTELIDHPVMVRVINNDELMERFERLAAGRVDEVLMIGADADINSLLEDKAIKQLITEIDLGDLLEQCERQSLIEK